MVAKLAYHAYLGGDGKEMIATETRRHAEIKKVFSVPRASVVNRHQVQ